MEKNYQLSGGLLKRARFYNVSWDEFQDYK